MKETISAVCCPQLFMPAGGDAKEDMANGQSKQVNWQKDKRFLEKTKGDQTESTQNQFFA